MKAVDIENQRYQEYDYCEMHLEEKMMFGFLKKHTANVKRKPKEMTVLDLGCGTGHVTAEIQKRGYRVTGLDFSPAAVQKANESGLTVRECDLDTGLGEPDESYDVVWMGDILEHVFDPIALLAETHRVLKKGGAVIISIPSDVGIVSRVKMLFGISHQEGVYRLYGYYKHHTFFTLRLIRYMLEKNHLWIREMQKILIYKRKRYRANYLPSAFYNEMVIYARKKS